ncbi:hypothetical protein DHEL01_v201566 [Diaporthe helianthi]|uniref:Heterokaryon incompatibility domain-containing protein n=1 Tax=Diaporthe helianthi TaxID=158607 RepID=A0A2P5IC44_DIAHE|nr:hypothetical protein DHEL01_v201566 [Diaporthe helianthi]
MRLLETDKLEVAFVRDDAIPPYAILSHTWADNEISLQDMQGSSTKHTPRKSRSLKKCTDAARLAASHGYRWIWIDTCCIDKTSSAELSEAINSMYKWYENASVCYVFLEDYPMDKQEANERLEELPETWTLHESRWATRGWTLQELVAPKVVRLYTKDWHYMGEKHDPSVCNALMRATGIETGVLSGHVAVAEISVANRMKWASKRLTTRPEDLAYCLMGLFGVNMPLLYGEGGSRAFIRLQEQILKETDDESIFAWELQPRDEDEAAQHNDEGMHGLLATSPSCFQNIRSIYLMPWGFQSPSSVPWSMTNRGLHVQLYIRPEHGATEEQYLAFLDCFQDHRESDANQDIEFQAYNPAIHLRRLWGDQYTRIRARICESLGERARHGGHHETFFVKQNPSPALPNLGIRGQQRFGRIAYTWRLQEVFPSESWNSDAGMFRLSLNRARGIQGMFRFTRSQHPRTPFSQLELYNEKMDVAVVLHKTARADLEAVCFPVPLDENTLEQAFNRLNRIWTKTPREDRDRLFREYQERIMAVPEVIKPVRAGRGLYLLNLRERFELQADLSGVPRLWETLAHNRRVTMELQDSLFELDGTPLDEESIMRIHVASSQRSESYQRQLELIGDELKSLLQPPRPRSYSKRDLLRQQMEEGAHDVEKVLLPAAVKICAAIITQDILELRSLLERVDISTITGPVSSFRGFHVIHVASFTTDPQILMALLESGLDPLAVTDEGLNAFQLASICGKVGVLASLLQLMPQARKSQTADTEGEEPEYNKAVSRFRSYFGSDAGLQDTALHPAAEHCSAEEFESIIEVILKATGIPIFTWTSSEITQERKYLACLRNARDETVLQRAAAAANTGVVRLICELTPGASTRLDSLGRSVLWHAAYGGDGEIVEIAASACSRSRGAPDLHLSDDDGVTPLHVACWRGNDECVKQLLKLGATPLSRTRELNLTPLHYAALFGQDACLGVMVDDTWRGTWQLGDFNTAMDMKASKDSMEMFAPIHLAAANGWLQCVRLLASNGATTSTTAGFYCKVSRGDSRDGLEGRFEGLVKVNPSTPAEMARREGHETVCRFLESFGPLDVSNRTETASMDSKSLLEDWNRVIVGSTQDSTENLSSMAYPHNLELRKRYQY